MNSINKLKILFVFFFSMNAISSQLFTVDDLSEKNYSEMSQQELDENLVIAVKKNNSMVVRKLVEAGANIAETIRYSTPCGEYDTVSTLLEYAQENGYKDITKQLIQARTNKNLSSAIVAASQVGDVDAVKKLMRAGVNSRFMESCSRALVVASEKGYFEIVRELIRGGIDVTYKDGGNIALIVASQKGYLKIVRELIRAGVDANSVDGWGNTALVKVVDSYCGSDKIKMIKLLLNAKCNVNHENKFGNTALKLAMLRNDSAVVHELIQAGADIAQKTKRNICGEESHLIFAINNCNKDVLNQFKKSKKVLLVASQEGKLNFVRDLVREGFDLNVADDNGDTALIIASGYGRVDIVKELIGAGAYINLANKNGDTALIEAVRRGNYDIVKILLGHQKINVKHTNKGGETALKIAIEKAPSPYLDYFSRDESLAREMIAKRLQEFSQ
tara:strand:+ start:27 stop:1364 length:1338 start_codon:yes stop_codon:yes gene_type:complete